MKTPACLAFVLSVSVTGPQVSAALGRLDPSLGNTGKVITVLATHSFATGVAVQSDGKIVATGGSGAEFWGSNGVIVRYNTDGTLDTSFNGNGKVIGTFGAMGARFHSVVIQPNGLVVAAGTGMLNQAGSSYEDFLLVRRGADGNPGQERLYGTGGEADCCNSLVLQPDGKLILAGSVPGVEFHSDFGLLRLHPDLSLDTSFQGGQSAPGWVNTNFGTPFFADVAYDVALQGDGKIVAAGSTSEGAFAVARYNSVGSLDTTFNGTGKVTTSIPNVPGGGTRVAEVSSVVAQPDGKILAAGTSRRGGGLSKITLVRYNSDGSLDTSFNDTGILVTTIEGDSTARGMALQSDGRIVIAGKLEGDFLAARYYGNGMLEGSATANFTGNDGSDEAYALVLQADGKIVVAGRVGNPNSTTNMALARFLPGDPAVPYAEIAVEQPAGVNYLGGSTPPQDYGIVLAGGSRSLTFTIRNQGNGDLTGLAVTKAATGTPGDFTVGPLTGTLAPGATATFTVTFAPAGPGVRTATLEIASNDANENPFIIHLTGSQATALETWRQLHFGSPDNTGPGADLNDVEQDGLVNLMEFATGNDPHVPTVSVGTLVKNGAYLEYTYTRPVAGAGELSYLPEVSTTLSGLWSGTSVVSTVLGDDGVTQTVRATAPAGQGKRFLRLRVTKP